MTCCGIVGEEGGELVLAGWERVGLVGEVAAAVAEAEIAAAESDADVVPLAVVVEVVRASR